MRSWRAAHNRRRACSGYISCRRCCFVLRSVRQEVAPPQLMQDIFNYSPVAAGEEPCAAPQHRIMWTGADANRDVDAAWLETHAAELRRELAEHSFAFVVGTHFSGLKRARLQPP